MGHTRWLAIALVAVSTVILFTASCSKKVVRSQETQQAQQARPTGPAPTTPAEIPKPPDSSTKKAAQAGRADEDRPRAEAAAREAAEWVFVNEHVRFGFDSSLLSDEARQILRGKAGYLHANPDVRATVEGHCDDRGTDAYNIGLGERRAESVKEFLVALGIGTDRLSTVSYGKGRPVAAGHDEASWARNRRAQLTIN